MTAGAEEKEAFPISSPRFSPLVSLLSPKLLGVNRVFFLLGKMDPASRAGEGSGGEGGGGGRVCVPSRLPPARRCCGRPRRRELGAARPGPPPGPPPRCPARSTAEDPRPGPDEPWRRAEDPGPAWRPLRTRAAGRREAGRCRLCFGRERAGPTRFAPPGPPRTRGPGWGGGWKALRWRGAWPAARPGGAVARRAPSSLAARAAPFAGAPAARAPGSRARGAGFCKWGRGRAALAFPCPQTQKPRPPARSGRGPGRRRLAPGYRSCWREAVGWGRAWRLTGSLPEPACPSGLNWE